MTVAQDEVLSTPPLHDAAERALGSLAALSHGPRLKKIRAGGLLTERARLLGLEFQPGQSAGGFCRLIGTRDAVIALNLPRESDWELLPAWLETTDKPTCWQTVEHRARMRYAVDLRDRARMLGLAAAVAADPPPQAPPFWRVNGPPLPDVPVAPPAVAPRVIDLSALWAGPLCGHLLHLAGADVIKVESTDRPDGARLGNAAFYGLLNQGKRCVAVNLRHDDGRQALLSLILSADVVIEAARPRALRQLGIDVAHLRRQRPSMTWVSITGYGRDEPEGNWIAFGDDAGVAAGLSQVMRRATGDLQILGDAIADPLTGIHAALAAWQSWCSGGGRLITLALADVAAASLAAALDHRGPEALQDSLAAWWGQVRGKRLNPRPVRTTTEPVHALGTHTSQILAELAAC